MSRRSLQKKSLPWKLKASERNRQHNISVTSDRNLSSQRSQNKLSLDQMGFSNSLIKIVAPTISSCVFDQFNKIIDKGVFQDSRVIPIHEERPLSDPSNYRPISLIPKIGEFFEKFLQSGLMSSLFKNDLLSKNQLGFLSKLSITDALVDLVEPICDMRFEIKLLVAFYWI